MSTLMTGTTFSSHGLHSGGHAKYTIKFIEWMKGLFTRWVVMFGPVHLLWPKDHRLLSLLQEPSATCTLGPCLLGRGQGWGEARTGREFPGRKVSKACSHALWQRRSDSPSVWASGWDTRMCSRRGGGWGVGVELREAQSNHGEEKQAGGGCYCYRTVKYHL